MAGATVCNIHGGRSLSGIASPTLKTGRYSKNLPARLAERYDASRTDGELLALRDDLALLDARLEDLLERVDRGECGELWQSLLGYVHAMKKAERKAESSASEKVVAEAKWEREEAIRSIEITCQEGVADYAAWSDVRATLEQRRRLAETETARLVKMQALITEEKAALLLGAVAGVIKSHVTDRTALAAISAELGRLVAVEAGGGPVPGHA